MLRHYIFIKNTKISIETIQTAFNKIKITLQFFLGAGLYILLIKKTILINKAK